MQETRDAGWIPELGRSSGGRNGYPLQYSCLENPMERRAWWATVHRVANNLTALNHFTCIHMHGQNCLLDEINEILTFILFYSLISFCFYFAYGFNKIIGPFDSSLVQTLRKTAITLFAGFLSLLF